MPEPQPAGGGPPGTGGHRWDIWVFTLVLTLGLGAMGGLIRQSVVRIDRRLERHEYGLERCDARLDRLDAALAALAATVAAAPRPQTPSSLRLTPSPAPQEQTPGEELPHD